MSLLAACGPTIAPDEEDAARTSGYASTGILSEQFEDIDDYRAHCQSLPDEDSCTGARHWHTDVILSCVWMSRVQVAYDPASGTCVSS